MFEFFFTFDVEKSEVVKYLHLNAKISRIFMIRVGIQSLFNSYVAICKVP